MTGPSEDTSVDAPFWEGLEHGILNIQRCSKCRQWTWPAQWRCGDCGSWDMEWESVAMEGVVHSMTWTRHPFTPEMQGKTPFANLLVELPQAGGARLLGTCIEQDEAMVIGAKVKGEVQVAAGGHALRWRLRA